MKILLSSTNKAKKEAVINFFTSIGGNYEYEFIDVDSGVSKTPENDDEGIQGCLNRIREAKKLVDNSDLIIGMEGIITKNNFGTFICGWVCIQDLEGNSFLGCSAKCMLPKKIGNNSDSFKELSSLVKAIYPKNLVDNIDRIGTNGVVTNSMYTRVDEFEDALKCAFGYMQNKETNQ